MVELERRSLQAVVRRLDETPGTPCPCGTAYRVVRGEDGSPASIHFVDIKHDSATHYHRTLTEIYTCLEGSGTLELNGERVPFEPGMVVVIPPLTRHRAVPAPGETLRVMNVVVPPFTEGDEWLD